VIVAFLANRLTPPRADLRLRQHPSWACLSAAPRCARLSVWVAAGSMAGSSVPTDRKLAVATTTVAR